MSVDTGIRPLPSYLEISSHRPLEGLMCVWPLQVRIEMARHPCLLIWGAWPFRYTGSQFCTSSFVTKFTTSRGWCVFRRGGGACRGDEIQATAGSDADILWRHVSCRVSSRVNARLRPASPHPTLHTCSEAFRTLSS